MRHAARACLCTSAFVGCLIAFAADASEQDQFEEKCVTRAAERAIKSTKTERGQWVKELEATYPNKVTNPTTEEEYGAWFDLLKGRNDEWKRDDAPNPQITALFEKVVQRMELGPVPTIKHDEFVKYAKRVLMREQREQRERDGEPQPDVNDESDKVFRTLDKNLDGDLDREEMTSGLKEERVLTDTDGNGRISKTEYRGYFQRKVAAKVEVLAAKNADGKGGGDKPDGKPNAKAGNGLPDWFTKLDLDKDGQISLYEWRQGGKPIAQFQEMDLNGDGLLTKDEYLRWVKLKAAEADQKRREEEGK